ncbi:hypothetical protein ACP4OV_019937 [Aristida adscensionis]
MPPPTPWLVAGPLGRRTIDGGAADGERTYDSTKPSSALMASEGRPIDQLPAFQAWNRKLLLRPNKQRCFDSAVGDQSQNAPNDDKATPKSTKQDDAKKLIQFMEDRYDDFVSRVQTFDEFYHAIFELIEMFCEERGQFQYKIPEKKTLENAYNRHHRSEGAVKKEEFVAMSKEVVGLSSFTFGKAAVEFVMVLFGAPVCAVLAKRILPGLGWLSDDVVIPLATSGSVAYLINSKRL